MAPKPPPPTTTMTTRQRRTGQSGDDNDDDQGARGGAGGGAKAVELPRVRVRIGRVFVPDSWQDGDVLRSVTADGVMLDLTPSSPLLPGQLVTFELP